MEIFTGCSLVAQTVKRLPTMQDTWVWSLGWEAPLEKEMATHSSTLAWRIPWTEEPCRLQSVGSQRVGHNWATSLPSTSFLPYKLCKYLEIIMYLSRGHLVLLLVSIWAKEYALNPVKNLPEFKVDFSLLKKILVGIYSCLTLNESETVSCSVMSDSLWPHGACQTPLPMEFSRQEYWSG